jgi:glycosyltransferase involved in cell wall biosynthesis
MRLLTFSNCNLETSQGSGYVVVNFARGMRAKGHKADVFGPEICEFFAFFKKAKTHRITLGIACVALWKLLRHKYDIVEFFGAESWLALSILSVLPGRRFMLVAHSNGLETQSAETQIKYLGATTLDGRPPKWYQKLLKPPLEAAFTRVEGLVTVSTYDRNYAVAKQYQPPERIVAIENPLLDSFLDQSVNFSRTQVVGFCGSWLSRKGCQTIREDLSRILVEFPNVILKLIGVGEDFHKERLFPSPLLGRIEVIPFVQDKATLRNLYHSISILAVPSIYESFGLVTAEAMSCGCAVVGTKTGFAASLQPRSEAMIMEEPTSPFLYDCVKELLLDEELRLRIARAGYARVQMLRWPATIDLLEATYTSWLQDFRNQRRTKEGRSR